MLEFLRFCLETEFTTVGGLINFTVLGVIALSLSGVDVLKIVFELFEFLYRVIDRLCHLVERFFELIAALARAEFSAARKPPAYTAPDVAVDFRALAAVAVAAIACALAVGGAQYDARGAPGKSGEVRLP